MFGYVLSMYSMLPYVYLCLQETKLDKPPFKELVQLNFSDDDDDLSAIDPLDPPTTFSDGDPASGSDDGGNDEDDDEAMLMKELAQPVSSKDTSSTTNRASIRNSHKPLSSCVPPTRDAFMKRSAMFLDKSPSAPSDDDTRTNKSKKARASSAKKK